MTATDDGDETCELCAKRPATPGGFIGVNGRVYHGETACDKCASGTFETLRFNAPFPQFENIVDMFTLGDCQRAITIIGSALDQLSVSEERLDADREKLQGRISQLETVEARIAELADD